MRLVRTAAALAAVSLVGAVATMVIPAPPAAAGGGCHTPPTEGRGTTVELSKLCMSPTVLRAEEGATVTFVNRDAMEHNVSGNGFYNDFAKAGDTWQYRFTASGTYAYACLLHPGMTGAIVVGDGVGGGPVVDAGPYRPEPVPVATSVASAMPASNSTDDEPASVPLPLAVAGAVAVAVVTAVATRRLSHLRMPAPLP